MSAWFVNWNIQEEDLIFNLFRWMQIHCNCHVIFFRFSSNEGTFAEKTLVNVKASKTKTLLDRRSKFITTRRLSLRFEKISLCQSCTVRYSNLWRNKSVYFWQFAISRWLKLEGWMELTRVLLWIVTKWSYVEHLRYHNSKQTKLNT